MPLLLVFVLLLLVGCEAPNTRPISTPLPGDAQEFRIASWNVRNFFDPVDDPYKDEVPTPAEYQSKIKELVNVIEVINPDFIALQEVENLRALSELNQSLSRPYPQLGLLEGNDHIRGIDVAFLSRLPIRSVTSHADHDLPDHPDVSRRYRFSRDCLEVVLETQPEVKVLINHLKSSRGDEKKSAAKRRVQSEGIVEIASQVDTEGSVLLVVGDMNDNPDSWAVEPLFRTFSDPFAGLDKKDRVTHRFRKKGSAIDHILVDKDGVELVFNPKVWSQIARSTSDHNPVSIQLKIKASDKALEPKSWTR